MAAGAVATIQKPKLGLKSFLTEASDDLVSAVLAASRANVALLAPRVQFAFCPMAAAAPLVESVASGVAA